MSPGWEGRDRPLCSLPSTQHGEHRQQGARGETPDMSGSLGLRVSCQEPALIPGSRRSCQDKEWPRGGRGRGVRQHCGEVGPAGLWAWVWGVGLSTWGSSL